MPRAFILHQWCYIWKVKRFLISFNFELTQLSLRSTLDWMLMVMSIGHDRSNANIVFSPTNVGKCAKARVDVVFGGMSDVPPSQKLNVLLCKRTLITIARWKSNQRKQLLAFLLHVMMVDCWASWVSQILVLLRWLEPLCGKFRREVCNW